MKGLIFTFAILSSLMLAVPLSAAAASDEAAVIQADALADMGLFRGTDSGYALDQTPTRMQSAVMLVRFLGKEEEALKLGYTAPFTDVPDWGKPYVQYLYSQGLVNGYDAVTYGADDPCTAKMYATIVLRVLGYDDKAGDFSYDGAVAYASGKGLITEDNCDTGEFLRRDMVTLTYTALTLPTADGGYARLAAKLSEDGTITAMQAEKVRSGEYLLGKIDESRTVITNGTEFDGYSYKMYEYYNQHAELICSDRFIYKDSHVLRVHSGGNGMPEWEQKLDNELLPISGMNYHEYEYYANGTLKTHIIKSPIDTIISSLSYDPDGTLVCSIECLQDGSYLVNDYYPNQIIRRAGYYTDAGELFKLYEFDENSRFKLYQGFSEDGTLQDWETYEYNDDGSFILTSHYIDGTTQSICLYNSEGKCVDYTSYYSDGVFSTRILFEYREDITVLTFLDEDGNFIEKRDLSGNLIIDDEP